MRKVTMFVMLVLAACMMGQSCDSDMDGVPNSRDLCPNTPTCATVDTNGCPSDSDDDGVYDGCDECEDSPGGSVVASNGCPPSLEPGCDTGPDPAAIDLQFEEVELLGIGFGTVRITGIVENLGPADFDSSQGQQSVQLWEDQSMVAETPFVDLAVGEQVKVTYDRTWSKSDEFKPRRYTVLLSYDPDIFIDGNQGNDDCDLDNNEAMRGTEAIDALFEEE